jgi:hypothetical protein
MLYICINEYAFVYIYRLVAARKKLGGAFPREGARKEMDQYARKLKKFQRINERRNRKLLKQEMEVAQEGQDKDLFSNVTKALAQRWVTMARVGIEAKFR